MLDELLQGLTKGGSGSILLIFILLLLFSGGFGDILAVVMVGDLTITYYLYFNSFPSRRIFLNTVDILLCFLFKKSNL